MMTHCHSDEFTCDWEIPYDPSKDIYAIAQKMIDEADTINDDSLNFFQQDFKIFKIASSFLIPVLIKSSTSFLNLIN